MNKISRDFTELMATVDPEVRLFMPPLLQEGTLGMIHAGTGVGKTHFCLWMALSVAAGAKFIKWEALTPAKVLYIDTEMNAKNIKKRAKEIVLSTDFDFMPDSFRSITCDQFPTSYIPDLATKEGANWLLKESEDRDIIIIDNLLGAIRIGDRNEISALAELERLLVRMRSEGKCVVVVHHSGKSGTQLGSSQKTKYLDWIINLRNPADYDMEDGSRFDLIFEKARDFYGKHAESLSLQLLRTSQGSQFWKWEVRANTVESLILKMYTAGQLKEHQISKETNLPLFKVKEICRKFKEDNESKKEKQVLVGRGLEETEEEDDLF